MSILAILISSPERLSKTLSRLQSPAKASRVVSALRLGAVALREERAQLKIDSPSAVADLCCKMRFLSYEFLRVVLFNNIGPFESGRRSRLCDLNYKVKI
jgi:hypothetical protein